MCFIFQGTGEMINTKFFCRLCALLHDPRSINPGHNMIEDFNEWWRGKGTCINGNWNKFFAALKKDREAGTVQKSKSVPKLKSIVSEDEHLEDNSQPDKEAKPVEELQEKPKSQVKPEDTSLDFEDKP